MTIEKIAINDNVLQKIRELDYTFYTVRVGISWYKERYKSCHSCIVLKDEDKIVGYLLAVPVKKELYAALISGCLLGDISINPIMFVEKSDYYYISSIVILKKYRQKGYSKQMMDLLFADLRNKYSCLFAVSESGYNLASKYLPQQCELTPNKTLFFSKNFTNMQHIH